MDPPRGKPVVDLMAGPVPPVMTNRLSRPVIERNQACKSVAGSRMCLAIAKNWDPWEAIVALDNVANSSAELVSIIPSLFNCGRN